MVDQAIARAFDAKACTEVEFPETYVFEHPPGEVDRDVVGSFEGLIAVAGEALSPLDYDASRRAAGLRDRHCGQVA